jgi:hypothetical protein
VRNVGEPAGSVVNLALRAAMIVALELSLRSKSPAVDEALHRSLAHTVSPDAGVGRRHRRGTAPQRSCRNMARFMSSSAFD